MRYKVKQQFKQFLLEKEESQPMYVCQSCLDDYMLKSLECALQAERVCFVCNKLTSSALTPERIAKFIQNHLKQHFQIDNGLYPGYEMTLDDVVSKAIGCRSQSLCRAVSACLEVHNASEEDFYWQGQEYSRIPSNFDSEEHRRWYVVGTWENIANGLTHGRRFFNDIAHSYFEKLILEALQAETSELAGIPAVITTLDTDTVFYRSRIANSDEEARLLMQNASIELGAAPKARAANNRMSPAGIPLLYVSREVATCIAEVRPSIGDKIVVGRLRSTAPLKIFDFTSLSNQLRHANISLFDPNYKERNEHRMMLEYLHDEIARPVRAGDLEYVVTQALAEFIRYDTQWAFDGIAFRSVQCQGGLNYALFDRGTVEAMQAPDWRPKFHIDIRTEDVSMYEIESVTYNHKEITESRK